MVKYSRRREIFKDRKFKMAGALKREGKKRQP